MPGALAGVRVADFTEYIAGPYCTMMLADMGADVVKVEPPDGDRWRHTATVGPYESRGYISLNRGKRSMVLDLEQAKAKPVLEKLLRWADVVVANYRPGVAKRLGLDYERVRAINPRIIYCENTGFGTQGPYSHRGGYDIISQAATGMMLYENKMVDGVPTSIAATAVADLTSGMFMAYGIVSALYARQLTGKGQRVETSLFASGLAAQYRPLLAIERFDREPRESFLMAVDALRKEGHGYSEQAEVRQQFIPARGQNNYYRVYETKDGLIVIGCLNNRLRRRLRDLLGIEDPMVDGSSYDWTDVALKEVHDKLTPIIEAAFRARTTEEWFQVLDEAGVPCGPVNFPEEMYDNEHVAANDLMLTLEHPVVGTIRMPACPIRMSETPAGAYVPSPALGADSADVLRELGYDDGAIAGFMDAGIVRCISPSSPPATDRP